jgi:hypothetical protein
MSTFTTKIVEATHKEPDSIKRQQIIKMCKIGEKIRLIREPNNPHDVCAIGVFRESGEQIGCLAKHVSAYPNLAYHMDIGGEVSAKVKEIVAERSGILGLKKTYSCIVEITKGSVPLFKKENEAKKIIKKARSIENNDPEFAIKLYQKAMTILEEMDRLCEKNCEGDRLIKIYGLKKWRFVEYPINRLTLVLEKLMRFKECLDQIEKYEQIDDKIGLTKKDKESLDHRKAQMIKIFHKKDRISYMAQENVAPKIETYVYQKKILHPNRFRRKEDGISYGSGSKGASYDRREKVGNGILLVDFDRRNSNDPYYSGSERRSGIDRRSGTDRRQYVC